VSSNDARASSQNSSFPFATTSKGFPKINQQLHKIQIGKGFDISKK